MQRQTLMNSKVKNIFRITLLLNFAVAAVKILLARQTESLSLFSDGVHSLLDGSSNVIALLMLRIAEQPPDEDHPYGHKKFETLGSMAISGLLCLAAWEILSSAWRRILEPVTLPHVNVQAVLGIVLMIGVNLAITTYERKWGKKLNSPLLLADAEHTKSDVFASVLALISLFAAWKQWYWVDTLAAILIVGLILWAAYGIVRDSVLTLSDARRLPPEPIRKIVEEVPGVINCHMVRSHGATGQVQIDLHIVVPPTLSAQETFEIENEVTRRLKAVYSEVSEVTVRHQTTMPASIRFNP